LIAFCPVFFAVQLFCNFGVSPNLIQGNSYSIHSGLAKNHPVKSDTKPSTQRHGFRLNKHFQPESLPTHDLIVIERPVEFISADQPLEAHHFIPSPFFETPALRGPPGLNNHS
jgi:hypothetical protein